MFAKKAAAGNSKGVKAEEERSLEDRTVAESSKGKGSSPKKEK